MAGLGTWRARKSTERAAGRSAAALGGDQWAGAAAAAAGAGARAAVSLLAMACWPSTATAGLFGMKLLKEHQHLQLEHAGKLWSFLREPSRGRVGSACRGATVWAFGCVETGAFAGSVRARERHVRT